ncbi:hypothetical protein SLUN_37725 [Streptomyces lunaelactis]|uniref:Uncharacterized protein n=1 Tax=Streptomyces lunaelactis TaxID=1535768 RepID=A0A2R4TD71_9ACTN|nr:hypothetical protein SLUN_37725 [Streptomyces lunaelactis]
MDPTWVASPPSRPSTPSRRFSVFGTLLHSACAPSPVGVAPGDGFPVSAKAVPVAASRPTAAVRARAAVLAVLITVYLLER